MNRKEFIISVFGAYIGFKSARDLFLEPDIPVIDMRMSSVILGPAKKLKAKWTIEYGPSTFVDGINGWVYHNTSPRNGDRRNFKSIKLGDHPWDDSPESLSCPYCKGDPI
jgi:rubredoxin